MSVKPERRNAVRMTGLIAYVLLLIGAQILAAQHGFDPDTYEPGHSCEVCLAASVVGCANTHSEVFVTGAGCHEPVGIRVDGLVNQRLSLAYSARAPPTAS